MKYFALVVFLLILLSGCVTQSDKKVNDSSLITGEVVYSETRGDDIQASERSCLDVDNSEKCFYELAVTSENVSYCDSAGIYKNQCLNEYNFLIAIKNKDSNYCSEIDDSVTDYSMSLKNQNKGNVWHTTLSGTGGSPGQLFTVSGMSFKIVNYDLDTNTATLLETEKGITYFISEDYTQIDSIKLKLDMIMAVGDIYLLNFEINETIVTNDFPKYCLNSVNNSGNLEDSETYNLKEYKINYLANFTQYYFDPNFWNDVFNLQSCEIRMENGEKKVFESTNLQEGCNFAVSVLNSDINSCSRISNCDRVCYLLIGIRDNNTDYCDQLKTLPWKSCMYNRISDDYATCMNIIAVNTANLSLCSEGYDNCESIVISSNPAKYQTLCLQAKDENNCYYNTAINLGDISICEFAGKMKISCLEKINK
ncbi:MAG: hypothetical protein GON13_00095 [Nanoarchaeota archaeon]|nr:hypothetical protein [Nanoarchaeota archaeon]